MADNETNGNMIQYFYGRWYHCAKSEAFVDDVIKVGLLLKEVLTPPEILRLPDLSGYARGQKIADILEREGVVFGNTPIRAIFEIHVQVECWRGTKA